MGENVPGQMVNESSLDDAIKQKVLADNALEFLGLTREQFLTTEDDTVDTLVANFSDLKVQNVESVNAQ